jgi:hypothetical protein
MPKTLLSRSLERYASIAAGTGSSLALLLSLGACSGETDTPAAAAGSAGTGLGGSGTAGSGGSSTALAGTSTGGSAVGGSGGTGTAGSAAGGGALEPTFAMVKGMIQSSCFGGLCHDLAEHPLQLKIDDKLYATLTTFQTETCGPLVKVGSPAESALVKLLKGPCGEIDRMPYGKCNQDGDEGCVSPATIAALEQWITQGAPQ